MKKLIIVCLTVSTAFLSQGLFAEGWGNTKLNKKSAVSFSRWWNVQLNINVGAGDLTITGKEGQSEITVIAKVFGEKLNDDDYVLSLEKKERKQFW